jgi:hypothetical protein
MIPASRNVVVLHSTQQLICLQRPESAQHSTKLQPRLHDLCFVLNKVSAPCSLQLLPTGVVLFAGASSSTVSQPAYTPPAKPASLVPGATRCAATAAGAEAAAAAQCTAAAAAAVQQPGLCTAPAGLGAAAAAATGAVDEPDVQ